MSQHGDISLLALSRSYWLQLRGGVISELDIDSADVTIGCPDITSWALIGVIDTSN